MKLELIKKLAESTATNEFGGLTSYGMILEGPSDYRIDYDEIESIQIFVDKNKFHKAIAKLFADFTEDPDDVFLTFEEICDSEKYDDFCNAVYIWDLF